MNNDSEKTSDKNTKRIEINRELCKGCGICVAFCPKNVLEVNEHEKAVVKNPDQCIYCGLCEQRCPDLAIEVIQ
jgi:2-oxoglutarate ferredoxin oxidoreductase subunit delta